MAELISRQAAIDAIEKLVIPEYMCVFEILSHIELAIGTLPSAQPQLPEWAQKVEEYRKIAPKTFSSPIAWALYQTWREYAERRTDERSV